MGVQARLVIYAENSERAGDGAERALELLRELDRCLSHWSEASELSRLVGRAGTGLVPVSPELFEALEQALAWSEVTRGAFDPTLGPLVSLWRESASTGRLPDAAALDRARSLTGRERVRLDASGAVALEPGTRLDLGGIGKGLACDRALDLLARAGLERSLVELGGDLALGAPPPGRAGWIIAAGCSEPRLRLELAHCGVATSGDREQHVVIDGVRYSHVIDPATGLGVTGRTCATVVAPSAAAADALASAACSIDVEALGVRGVRVYGREAGGAGDETRARLALSAPPR